MVSRAQLLRRRYTRHAIETRLGTGRLHCIYRGVYAVGHTKLTVRARWMAAVLACGEAAALSHQDAAALHGLLKVDSGDIHVTAPTRHNIDGIHCHFARSIHSRDVTKIHGLPLPLTNQYVEGEFVDAYWPDQAVVVEVDGWKTHKTRAAFETDRVRDSKLAAAHFRVLRFTYRRIEDDPRGVADDLRRALS
jgi:hypothetical protein